MTLRPSPLSNRVTPYGERIAVNDRGLLWGNRGSLHDADGTFVRYSRGKGWVICALEFKGRHRQLLTPGRLSELFFLDEATALAAGHRPCGECRVAAYRAFKAAWFAGASRSTGSAAEMDAGLHADRLVAPGTKRTYDAALCTLPSGVFIELDGEPWLVHAEQLLGWTPGGYDRQRARPSCDAVRVLTPRSSVAALEAGFHPLLHPSALAGVPPTWAHPI